MGRTRDMAAAIARVARERRAMSASATAPSGRRGAAALAGDRLLIKPVFVLSSVRSGSTLLRVMLNTHSQIYAPHEMHLTGLQVQLRNKYVTGAMEELGMDADTLQFLLWDRLLHRELTRHGKRVLVNKTPSDALMWRRIVQCWPDVRFIYLLRHPAAVTDSWHRARKQWTREQTAEDVLRYMDALEEARTEYGGLTVRYEDLTIAPERETRRICTFLGIAWEPKMLHYGEGSHGNFRAGLGDWSPRIKSGTIQPAKPVPPPDKMPRALVDISTRWGYLAGSAAPALDTAAPVLDTAGEPEASGEPLS